MTNMATPEKHCEDCHYYRMIDSGYGYCTGNPPSIPPTPIPWWERFLTWVTLYHYVRKDPRSDYPFEGYPIVGWDIFACRLFFKRDKS